MVSDSDEKSDESSASKENNLNSVYYRVYLYYFLISYGYQFSIVQ